MAKRKSDCDVDAFVLRYLKKAKFHKTSSLFGKSIVKQKSTMPKLSEEFLFYLKRPKIKQENEDDLGFEINFGAYESTKVNLKFLHT